MTTRVGRRRWPWMVGASVGTAVLLAGVWSLQRPLVEYLSRPLGEQDEIASVASMFVGMAALVISALALLQGAVQARRAVRDDVVEQRDRTASAGSNAQYVTSFGGLAAGAINGNVSVPEPGVDRQPAPADREAAR